jgi:hypothetical protein
MSVLRLSAVALVALAAILLPGTRADAAPAWCMQFGSDPHGVHCGYLTLEHCRRALIGNGYCVPDPLVADTNSRPDPQRRKRQR